MRTIKTEIIVKQMLRGAKGAHRANCYNGRVDVQKKINLNRLLRAKKNKLIFAPKRKLLMSGIKLITKAFGNPFFIDA